MANVYFANPVTYSGYYVPTIQRTTSNIDGSILVTYGGTSPNSVYSYTVTLTSSSNTYGTNVNIHEFAPSIPDFSGNDYSGNLTGYNNGGAFTVQNVRSGTSYESFTWLFLSAIDNTGTVTLYPDSRGGSYVPPPCFAEGSSILTIRGEVPVEALSVGDVVVTALGARRPIRWIGHRRTDISRHPHPEKVMPICIRVGALAQGVPARDLRVSPGHAVAVDGVLVKAGRLVNGATILREDIARITYWHVELDSHDLLVAEGLAAESYVACGNRHAFENGGSATALHPEFEALAEHAARTCLPLVDGGAELATIRGRVIARAGDSFSADPAVRLVADGLVLAPASVEGNRYRFLLPKAVASVRLVSRSAIPAQVHADSRDRRLLGVAVRNLTVDGVAISCDLLGEGWHTQTPGRDNRWSDGDAALPPGREIAFIASALERYLLEPSEAVRRVA